MDLATVARGTNSYFRYRRKVSEGTKGPIKYEFTKRRVTLGKDGLPHKTVWLIIKRALGADREYSYYINNAPPSTRLRLFVWLSGVRRAVLPMRILGIEELLAMVAWVQVRNHRAYSSHPERKSCPMTSVSL